ncbi:MAG: diaminopimelate decarboxylase [Gemmatimonadota bacterium]|jgi:diaminopimelate decarboxylase|nr:diaminopimelate decarboxylase [Gemmatimonadota bacterium]
MAETFVRHDGVLHCEDVAIPDIVARWGTPSYVYSAGAIRRRFEELSGALGDYPHLIAYSVKANGNLEVLRTLAELGAGADIVSGGELYRARLAGIPADRIVFSGVGKTVNELAAGLSAGIYGFNIESEGELEELSRLASASGMVAPVALRVNPGVDAPTPHHYTRTGHAATKFGIPISDAPRLYAKAASLPGIRVRGVDMHIGSQILAVEPYQDAVAQVVELVHVLRSQGHQLEYLDVGGGLGISYSGGEGISARAFADAILPLLQGSELRLVLEPGRYIVGQAGVLVTRVLYLKEGGGKRFVITDAGMNDLLRPSHYSGYHAVEPVEATADREEVRVDVVGPICETGDFLALDRDVPRVEPGELLVLRTAGAYGFSMASTYNQRPRPAEVMVSGGEMRLARRRETLEDLVAGELDL